MLLLASAQLHLVDEHGHKHLHMSTFWLLTMLLLGTGRRLNKGKLVFGHSIWMLHCWLTTGASNSHYSNGIC